MVGSLLQLGAEGLAGGRAEIEAVMNQAFELLRKAGQLNELPRALLARATAGAVGPVRRGRGRPAGDSRDDPAWADEAVRGRCEVAMGESDRRPGQGIQDLRRTVYPGGQTDVGGGPRGDRGPGLSTEEARGSGPPSEARSAMKSAPSRGRMTAGCCSTRRPRTARRQSSKGRGPRARRYPHPPW